MPRSTECSCLRIAQWSPQAYSFFAHQPMSECCRKAVFFLAYVVATVGSVAYCFYLIWLLAYLKDNGYYWFFAFIPAFFVLLSLVMVYKKDDIRRDWDLVHLYVVLGGVVLTLMCSFTMLTRQAYYRLSADVFIGPQWIIMSLKGGIVFIVCSFLADKECRLKEIREHKEILTRGLLDFVDIFNLLELLSLNKCVGIGSSVKEGSSLEVAIQVLCTMSLLILIRVNEDAEYRDDDDSCLPGVYAIYPLSALCQNIPFLVIRIIVWAWYNVFSLGFMVKNVLAIVVCCAEIFTKPRVGADDEKRNNARPNVTSHDNQGACDTNA